MGIFRRRYNERDTGSTKRNGRFRRAVVIAVGVAALAVLYLWQYVTLLEVNYKVERNRRFLAELEKETTSLKTELYRRRSLEQVGKTAREKLGMRPPEKGEIIIIKE
ncbi:MAG: cell division protein FtsL [Candidatus Coatesbacteria bacterium]|nr:MAG: cell division protein FtsL [Candidatus Coatesbacteria bacterium]